MVLLVDFYNTYKRIKDFKGSVVYNYFHFIHCLKLKFKVNEVYFAFDGTSYFKKVIDPSYKSNRKSKSEVDTTPETIKNIIPSFNGFNILYENSLEADDIAYLFCKEKDNCICISEDYDWLITLTVGKNIKIYRQKILVDRDNFYEIFKYPIDKIPLDLFLRGDIKDGVKKPFRIKGSVLENISNYADIQEYKIKNNLINENVDKYEKLVFPLTDIPYTTIKGKKDSNTSYFIKKFRLSFMRPKSIQMEMSI